MSGVFAVDRGIWEHPSFAAEPFTEREAWMWLIGAAVWKPQRVRVGRKTFDLARGQCVFSLRFLARKWKWGSYSRVRRFLDRLKIDTAIETVVTREATQITICNYEKHQFGGNTDDPPNETPIEPPAKHSRNKEEEGKESKKKKEEDTSLRSDDDSKELSGKYAFESGVIRLDKKDFDGWVAAFPNIDLRAELLSLTQWASEQPPGKWFYPVSSALAKRNREQKLRLAQALSPARQRELVDFDDPEWRHRHRLDGII